MPGPTILCRRLSFYVAATGLSSSRVFLTPTRSALVSRISVLAVRGYVTHAKSRRSTRKRSVEEGRKSARTCWECVNRLYTADDRPRAFRASAIKNSVRSRVISPSRSTKPGTATQSAMYRGFDRFPRREHRCCIRSGGPRVIERGPPGTRRAPSAAADSFGASVRTRSAYLLRTGIQKRAESPRARCPRAKNIFTRRRISAVAKRPCLRADRADRSIFKDPHW